MAAAENAAVVIRQPYKRDELFHDREVVLANAAKRAGPAVGDGFKGGAGSDTAVGIAFCWVIDVTADVANVLFHVDGV